MKKLLSAILLGLVITSATSYLAPSAFADDDEFICYDDNNNGTCDPGEENTASGATE